MKQAEFFMKLDLNSFQSSTTESAVLSPGLAIWLSEVSVFLKGDSSHFRKGLCLCSYYGLNTCTNKMPWRWGGGRILN